MHLRHSGFAALLILGLAGKATAQEVAPVPRPVEPRAAAQALDVSRLPVNVDRIRRGLRQSTVREDFNGLNLRYAIDVFGSAPRIDFFDPKRDNLRDGPVPYGGPTHQQMLEAVTPREYRAPVMDFSALMRWLQQKSK